ncbi:MAG: PH domain-containing protein [Candidatus Dormibacteria bacterium]
MSAGGTAGSPPTGVPARGRTADPGPFDSDAGWHRPSLRLRQMRVLETAAGTLAALVVGAVAAVASGHPLALAAAAVVILAAGWLLATFMARRSGSWGYLEREDDLLVRRGVMFRRLSVVPYGRMQTVEVTAGPVERSFHLATIRLHTASAASDARIPGLEAWAANALRDRLATVGEARAEGL